ncbi:MAG: ATP synthase subunit I [Pseudomonadota bacterium]
MAQLAFMQAVCTATFSATLYFCFTAYEAVSAILGGGTAVVANLLLAVKTRADIANISAPDRDEDAVAKELLYRFYRFEVFKVVFTLTIFAICIVVMKVSILAFIIAYLLAALIVTWLSLLTIDQH